jgi:hypothetical protein
MSFLKYWILSEKKVSHTFFSLFYLFQFSPSSWKSYFQPKVGRFCYTAAAAALNTIGPEESKSHQSTKDIAEQGRTEQKKWKKKESPKRGERGGWGWAIITSEAPRSNSDRHGVCVVEGMGADSFSAQ